MAKRERASDISGNEEYVRGRRAGVDNTYGEDHDGVAERTIASGKRDSNGGGEDGLNAAASAIYKKAVKNGDGKDPMGDQAIHDR
ncbi:MAG TPA: hypothetical protein VNZ53_19375 [Steroidobacteraceae bacterium]|jgi:hypothetical protein|nr:hypothetical protein [Steroidobacteraceae bacterium]